MKDILEYISKNYSERKNALLCKNSKCEKHFSELLKQSCIFFWQEKCCYNKKGNWCYIDFYLPMYKIGIEIDGREHRLAERRKKDAIKDAFLLKERNIKIVRITNNECMNMQKVSIIELVKRAGLNKTSERQVEYKRKQRAAELKYLAGIMENADEEVWLYDKTKDYVFHFKDMYIAKHSTGIDYKYLLSALKNNDNINQSRLFIISNSKEELSVLVDKYYEYLWRRKQKNQLTTN